MKRNFKNETGVSQGGRTAELLQSTLRIRRCNCCSEYRIRVQHRIQGQACG